MGHSISKSRLEAAVSPASQAELQGVRRAVSRDLRSRGVVQRMAAQHTATSRKGQLNADEKFKHARIAIKTDKRIILIKLAEVITIEAKGNYALICQNAKSYAIREKLSALADLLRPYGFIQIHRSVVVNIMHVESLESLTTGEYRLQLPNRQLYNVTRTYKNNLHCLAELWIGLAISRRRIGTW